MAAAPTTERFRIRSTDGVEISVQKAGSGQALLLVHGALLNGSISWGAVLPKLADDFTVYAMDRRGRAPSGDAANYSLSVEADDIASVVNAIGGPVKILGHSYGALATLDAIEQLRGVDHLILYEPPLILAPRSAETAARMQATLDAGDLNTVVTIFLRDQIGVAPEVLAGFQAAPFFPVILQIAPTLPRESREVNKLRSWRERLAQCRILTTMLLGSETHGLLEDATNFVSRTIPGCRIVMLEGQGHGAVMEAPDLFIAKVLELARA
jgi:pimeloyl-ACP methyl ester carboxylesterase